MKVVLAGLAIVAAAVGAGIGYTSMKTTALPEWYDSTAAAPIGNAAAEPSQNSVENPLVVISDRLNPANIETANIETARTDSANIETANIETASIETANIETANTDIASPSSRNTSTSNFPAANADSSRSGDITISADDINQMVTAAITATPQAAPILDAARGINTTLEKGRIESGMVINIADIPTEALPAEGQAAIDQITQTFPFLANREVYLGIEGSPTIVDGALSLNDTHIKFGQLRLPASAVASQIGISQTEIEQRINALMAQQGIAPSDVEILDGQLIIRGLATAQ